MSTTASTSCTNSTNPGVFRAAVCTELNKPLQILSQQRPTITGQQVRVAVDYGAINFADILQVADKYQVKTQTPFIPGSEFVGRVIEVGGDVSDFKPGDRIVGAASTSAAVYSGAFAEEAVTDKVFFSLEERLSAAEGAALTWSYGTAFMTLSSRGKIQQSDVVLVTAAAGALGLATVDLAANVFGAKVIGVCGGADKCKLVKSYGAVEVIDYKVEKIRDRVKEITGGQGVNIAVDAVGGSVFEDCLKSMAMEGQLFTLGYSGGNIPKIAANYLLLKNIAVAGVYWGNYAFLKPQSFRDSVEQVVKLWKQGKVKPHVGKIFPLAQINEAYQYVASRQSVGKVLIDCSKHSAL